MSRANVRRATPADAAELTRLRAEMFTAYGTDASEPGWQAACTEMLARRLASQPEAVRETMVAFVVDDPQRPGCLLAGGVGWTEEHLPGPGHQTGVRGHIASMSTDPRARRQGLGRLVLRALLDHFDRQGATRVDLFAAEMGDALYRAEGFRNAVSPALSWYAPGALRPHWRRVGPEVKEPAG